MADEPRGCARQDSNLRHVASKATALSPELRGRPVDRAANRSLGTAGGCYSEPREGGRWWPVGGGSTPPTGPIREGSHSMPARPAGTTPPGDPTLRMLGECACAVNWDAPGGGTAHATDSPLPRAPTGDAAAHPGLGARAAAWF